MSSKKPKVAFAWMSTASGATGGTGSLRAGMRSADAAAGARLIGLWV